MPPNLPEGGPDNLVRLPPVLTYLDQRQAAVFLGLSTSRLRALRVLGAGPKAVRKARQVAYRQEELDLYLASLYRRADISDGERQRRRRDGAAARREKIATLGEMGRGARVPWSEAEERDAFAMLASGAELAEHGVHFVLKAMALFGLIMLCISATPLLHAHFN